MLENKKILTILAHPDDEVLGAGGTLFKANTLGSEIHVVIPATGIHSRRNKRSKTCRDNALKKLRDDCRKAIGILGVNSNHIYLGEFADNEMDTSSLLSVVHFLERHIEKIKPDVIMTHHFNRTNIDHKMCYEAAIVATRPHVSRHITVLSCEIPSSTGYLKPTMWEPNIYVEITEEALNAKIKAMEAYSGEARPDPHPRSSEVLRALAKVRGSEAGFLYAESFMMVKGFW